MGQVLLIDQQTQRRKVEGYDEKVICNIVVSMLIGYPSPNHRRTGRKVAG